MHEHVAGYCLTSRTHLHYLQPFSKLAVQPKKHFLIVHDHLTESKH